MDVAMQWRRVWKFGLDRYRVENAKADTEAYYATAEAAIEAENESLIKAYAKQHGISVSYVKYQLDEDFEFLSNERERGVRFSRNISDKKVTLTKRKLAALRANYHGDKMVKYHDGKTASAVGIDKSHTPIMADAASVVSILHLFVFVKDLFSVS